jgi:hypothetical protein
MSRKLRAWPRKHLATRDELEKQRQQNQNRTRSKRLHQEIKEPGKNENLSTKSKGNYQNHTSEQE